MSPNPNPLQQDFSVLSLPPAFKTGCSTTAGKPNLVQILLQPCWFLSLFTSINFNGFAYINFVLNQFGGKFLLENRLGNFPLLFNSLGCSGMTATLGGQ